MHPDKGPLEAIKIAKASGRKLIMAGIIQDEDYYKQQVEPLLDENIVYIGSVGPTERDALLGHASALLHPIYFHEPFGLSIIESMACGTPVIAFNKGSMPEIIKNNENGFIVNTVDEAINRVEKIKEIDRMSCRRHVEDQFTVERMAKQYIQVYQSILETKIKDKYVDSKPNS